MMKPRLFIYFNADTADIRGVSPIELPDEFPGATMGRIRYEVGIKFLTGEENVHNWYAGIRNGKLVVSQNYFDIPAVKQGEYYAIPRVDHRIQNAIQATVYLNSSVIEFSIPSVNIGKKPESIEATEMTFYMTKRNDPSHLLAEFKIDIDELFKTGSITCEFESTYRDFSLFTSKVFNSYAFEVKKNRLHRAQNTVGARVNKLVGYRPSAKIPEQFSGLVAFYHVNKRRLELRVWNDAAITAPTPQSVILITRKHDPTVFVTAVSFDLAQLMAQESIQIQLPYEADTFDFGLAGYPLAEDMIFVRNDDAE